ncbi:UNVERIFIED_ORG: hypothetical protein GGE11_003256 [Mycolicibacterium obuense]
MFDRAELVRTLAAMTDDEYREVTAEARGDTDKQLRELTRDLFGRDQGARVDLGRPTERSSNVVRTEGANPDPGIHFSDDDHLRQLTRQMFNPTLAATDPVTFDAVDPERP